MTSLIYALHPYTSHNLFLETTPFHHTLSGQSIAAEPVSDGGAAAEKLISGREEFGDSSNLFSAILAMVLWLGAIHFNIALILLAVFFLPLSKSLLFVIHLSRALHFSVQFN